MFPLLDSLSHLCPQVLSSSRPGAFLVSVCPQASHLLEGPELDTRSLSYCPLCISGDLEMREYGLSLAGLRPSQALSGAFRDGRPDTHRQKGMKSEERGVGKKEEGLA